MNDIDIETRLREQLPRLADLAVGASEPTVPLAPVELLEPARRRRWKVVAAAGIAAGLIVGGVVIVDALRSPVGRRAPIGISSEPSPPVSTLTITVRNFFFDQTEYHVPPGRYEIHFVSAEGSHALHFADRFLGADDLKAASNAPLHGPQSLEKFSSATVDLAAGHAYRVYDPLPGHEQAGESATIVVDQPAPTSTTAP
jgi:hypothetical protein